MYIYNISKKNTKIQTFFNFLRKILRINASLNNTHDVGYT